jgi:hypothetical protein
VYNSRNESGRESDVPVLECGETLRGTDELLTQNQWMFLEYGMKTNDVKVAPEAAV